MLVCLKRYKQVLSILMIVVFLITGCSYNTSTHVPPMYTQHIVEEYDKVTSESLALEAFYQNNPYSKVFEDTKEDDIEVDPYVEPQMGWKTQGLKAENPTKVAADGMSFVLNGRVKAAERQLEWLISKRQTRNDAYLFDFNFDFEPYWPFILEKPWSSGLTQGMALGLAAYVYKETGEVKYKKIADKIFNSFMVPKSEGGFVLLDDKGRPFIEEYPTEVSTKVLNGSIVALLAIHDYSVITKNEKAKKFFSDASGYLNDLLPQYDIALQDYNIHASSYSLAPVSKEMLLRFIGDGDAIVKSIDVTINGDSYYSLELGTEEDSNVSKPSYIWIDNQYMNWGTSLGNGRKVNGNVGEYGHSPFKIRLPNNTILSKVKVEVSYVNNFDQIKLNAYDGNQYWNVEEIQSDSETKKIYVLTDDFLKSFEENLPKYSLPDVRYLDDNRLLVTLMRRLNPSMGNYKIYSERWKDADKLVPSNFINNLSQSPIKSFKSLTEASNVVNLSKAKSLDQELMIIEKREEDITRFELVEVKNETVFKFAGTIYSNEYFLKNKVHSPKLLYDNKAKLFKLYFVKDNDDSGIYYMTSGNGYQWSVPTPIIKGQFKVFTIYEENDVSKLYAVIEENQHQYLSYLEVKNNRILILKPMVSISDNIKLENVDSIEYIKSKENNTLIIGVQLPNRHDMLYFNSYESNGRVELIERIPDIYNLQESSFKSYQYIENDSFLAIKNNGIKNEIGIMTIDLNRKRE